MDIIITIVAGLLLGYTLIKVVSRLASHIQPKSPIIPPTIKHKKSTNTFAESVGGGRKCPPHAWAELYEDKYGLQCQWCKLTFP